MTTTAGNLDRYILVEKKSTTQDPDFGTEIVTWVPLAGTVQNPEWFRAEVLDLMPSRAEGVTLGLTVAKNQTRIRMRYRDDINSSMRVTLLGDSASMVMQIVGGPSAIEGRKQFLEIVCERFSS